MQLVKYDQPRYLAVAFATSPTMSRTVMIWPGINELSDKDWSDVKNHPAIKGVLELGHLTEVSKRAGNESMLKAMSQDEAINLVHETNSVDLLKKWLIEEKRHLVIRTISQKLNDMVLPDRRDASFDDKMSATGTDSEPGLDEDFPRADKLGADKVAKKNAGKRAKR